MSCQLFSNQLAKMLSRWRSMGRIRKLSASMLTWMRRKTTIGNSAKKAQLQTICSWVPSTIWCIKIHSRPWASKKRKESLIQTLRQLLLTTVMMIIMLASFLKKWARSSLKSQILGKWNEIWVETLNYSEWWRHWRIKITTMGTFSDSRLRQHWIFLLSDTI